MDGKASLLNTIAYISFVSYGLLLAFTISFFTKAASTKNLAIIYFGSNIVAFLIMTYLLIQIDLPTMRVMSGVIGGVMQTLFALTWIRYFMVSERVEKTFINGSNGEITVAICLSVILFTSLSYSKQSSKETIMAGRTATTVQTTSEAVAASNYASEEPSINNEVNAPISIEDETTPEVDIMYPLDTFTVNLLSESGRRYLKIEMNLEIDKRLAIELDEKKLVLRDIIIRVLSSKSLEEISTAKGKEILKEQIATELNMRVKNGKVKNVYFVDFVVQ